MDALIGSTGFVGKILSRQHYFEDGFNSKTIEEAAGRSYEVVVCAAAPGSMFEANKFPDRDMQRLEALSRSLSEIKAENFILISSIAVLASFHGQDDEATTLFQTDITYGRNRRKLEAFVQDHFDRCLIVRLPALFGPGLKKNFVFDLLNPCPTMLTEQKLQLIRDANSELRDRLTTLYSFDNAMGMYRLDRDALNKCKDRTEIESALADQGATAVAFHNPDTTYQFYNMARLWDDITLARSGDIDILHLAPEPLRAGTIHDTLLGRPMPDNEARIHREDLWTRHADLWGLAGPYQYSEATILDELAAFFNRERIEDDPYR